MSRTFHDLSPAERTAYQVYQSKLADRTLPAAEHDRIRKEIDNLLWKGPNAQVLALKADLAAATAKLANALERIERLEFHAGLNDLGQHTADFLFGPADEPGVLAVPAKTLPLTNPAVPPIPPAGAGAPRPNPFLRPPLTVQTQPVRTEVNPAGASMPIPADPFDVPSVGVGLAPCGQFTVDPHPSDNDVRSFPSAPGEPEPGKKAGRGRPKGAKNKPKAPPVASGEGNEQPATTVAEGVVTASNPSFTDAMIDGVEDDPAPDDIENGWEEEDPAGNGTEIVWP